MSILTTIILVLFLFIMPAYLMKMSKKLALNKFLSDIVVCFAVGILLGNTKQFWLYGWGFTIPNEVDQVLKGIPQGISEAMVLLSMPMLLMINSVKDWVKHTGKITLVFLICSLAVMAITYTVGSWYGDKLPDMPTAAGMMTGVYIGGTPNMVAISKALHADEALFGLLNATDTFCSGLYLFFMLSLAKPLFGLVLPKFKSKLAQGEIEHEIQDEQEHHFPPKNWSWKNISPLLIAVGISIVAIALSIIPAMLIPDVNGKMNTTILILTLTVLGIALSFWSFARNLPGVYNFAQYLLLVFGLATGFMADFGQMVQTGGIYLGFNAIIVVSILIAHFLIALIMRADVDSFIVASVANVLGPPFIGQTTSAIKNRELTPVGIALGLLGLAIANFCGILIHYLLS